MAAVLCVVIAIVVISAPTGSGWSGSPSYTVEAGPVGSAVVLTLPPQVGAQVLLTNDSTPDWKFFPTLLPAGSSSSYGTVSGIYATASVTDPGVTVDAVYARQASDGSHRGVFSITPQALANLVVASMDLTDARGYPATAGAVLECGMYVGSPECAWAGDSTLVLTSYTGTPGSVSELATLTPPFRQAMTRP
jgi:hypothetical protein